ncbi:hypothetical protein PAPYR_2534 [Paratrimastix pyriformis]|uniref:Uncharacterized protein n=1 Tax=Paratrimastix pyriformis TaxID=342808 RepID=A0ABQ8UUN8_9EUKA|nr:hypothetical protein PAPYR_2534 [Paratrimastix pyriformis]
MGPEGTPVSLRLYILLIGLSHATRKAIRGTLRQISFAETDPEDSADGIETEVVLATPTADALAALVGPCKDLAELSLPTRDPAMWGCGRTEAVYCPWVDEAFAGHTQLAVLHIPYGDAVLAALPRILGHLSGLVEFRLELSDDAPLEAPLDALVGCCPRLEALHLNLRMRGFQSCEFDPTLLTRSPHFCGRLKQLTISGALRNDAVFLQSFTNLERLHLGTTPTLAPVAPHLTHLTLNGGYQDGRALLDLGLTRLESLTLCDGASCTDMARLLTANRTTIRSLSVRPSGPVGSLFQVLATCSVLTDLDLVIRASAPGEVNLTDLPPSLLNQLRTLRLGVLTTPLEAYLNPIDIASASLQKLNLDMIYRGLGTSVVLTCPALEMLTLPSPIDSATILNYPLFLHCPRLQRILNLGEQSLTDCQPMPLLDQVGYHWQCRKCPSLDALRALSPRLSWVSGAHLADPQELVELCQMMPALASLQVILSPFRLAIPGDDSQLTRVELRLPAHVEHLDLTLATTNDVDGAGADVDVDADFDADVDADADADADAEKPVGEEPFDMSVGSSGLRDFSFCGSGCVCVNSLDLCCPALVDLQLSSLPTLTAFNLDTAPVGPGTDGSSRLRSLYIDDCHALEAAPLMACLGQHGDRLSDLFIVSTPVPCCEAWSQLTATLSALPRLTRLELSGHPADLNLTLTCPALRIFNDYGTTPRSLVLDCPLLEEQRVLLDTNAERFELVGEAPYLRLVGGVSSPWAERLKGRWPGAMLMTDL